GRGRDLGGRADRARRAGVDAEQVEQPRVLVGGEHVPGLPRAGAGQLAGAETRGGEQPQPGGGAVVGDPGDQHHRVGAGGRAGQHRVELGGDGGDRLLAGAVTGRRAVPDVAEVDDHEVAALDRVRDVLRERRGEVAAVVGDGAVGGGERDRGPGADRGRRDPGRGEHVAQRPGLGAEGGVVGGGEVAVPAGDRAVDGFARVVAAAGRAVARRDREPAVRRARDRGRAAHHQRAGGEVV